MSRARQMFLLAIAFVVAVAFIILTYPGGG